MKPALGIDIGGTSVKFGVVKDDKIVGTSAPIKTQQYKSREELISQIVSTVQEIRVEYPDLSSVGVGVPGFVNFETGVISNLTNVKGWTNVPMKEILEAHLSLPVIVDNDANAMAYAEWSSGAGVGTKDLVALTLGTGVGAGIIVNEKLVRGMNSAAGELGQTSVAYNGRLGEYGNPGALEDYIGNREIIQEALSLYKQQGIEKTVDELTPADLSDLAKMNDAVSLELWDWVAEKLACTLMNCCYLLNPEMIIIGGGISKAGGLIFNPVRERLNKWLPSPFVEGLKIVSAKYGNEAGIIGCAKQASLVAS